MSDDKDATFYAWPFGYRESKKDTPLKKERFDSLRNYFKIKHHKEAYDDIDSFVIREFTKIT